MSVSIIAEILPIIIIEDIQEELILEVLEPIVRIALPLLAMAEDTVGIMVEVMQEHIVEAMEEDIVEGKKGFWYYFWLVFYFIKHSPEIIYLLVYRELLIIRLMILEFLGF
jgi:hypothetical protein